MAEGVEDIGRRDCAGREEAPPSLFEGLKRAAMAKGDFARAEQYDEREQEFAQGLDAFGVYLNIDTVKDLCNKVVEAARVDLLNSAAIKLKH